MTKTLYDPAVEQKGIEKGMEKGIEKGIEKVLIMQYKKGLSIEYIAEISGLDVEYVRAAVKDSIQ